MKENHKKQPLGAKETKTQAPEKEIKRISKRLTNNDSRLALAPYYQNN